MFLADDILFFPVRGLLWIFREIYNATEQERVNESEAITQELSELYMMLETGRISEAEFDAKEAELLDRLDALEGPVEPVEGAYLQETEPPNGADESRGR